MSESVICRHLQEFPNVGYISVNEPKESSPMITCETKYCRIGRTDRLMLQEILKLSDRIDAKDGISLESFVNFRLSDDLTYYAAYDRYGEGKFEDLRIAPK